MPLRRSAWIASGGDHAFADLFGLFAAGGAGEFFVFDEGDFDMEVDAIK